MSQLPNYPNENQLLAGVNRLFDCVPASLCDALEYLTGKRYKVEDIKAAAYGANYVGGTAARAYIPFCASQGVHLYPVDGDPPALVRAIHEHIQAGRPCIGTEPDVYAPAHPDWSHVISFYREDNGSLTARDPFGAHDVTHTDAEWAKLLEFREIWVLERAGAIGVPQGWHDDGATLTAPNGVPVVRGFRDYVLSHSWDAANVARGPEYHTDQLEGSNPALGAGQQQLFQWSMLGWNAQHGVIFEYVGQELEFTRKKLAEVYAAYKKAADTVAQLQSQRSQAQAMSQEHAALLQIVEQGAQVLGKKLV